MSENLETSEIEYEHTDSDSEDMWKSQEVELFPMSEAERLEVMRLKKLIKRKPEVFILDNLMMSVPLFKHYKNEVHMAKKKLKLEETKMNDQLIKTRQGKVTIIPDLARELMKKNVRLTSYTGDMLTVEPLHSTQIYVVYDNVFVQQLDESRDYLNPEDLKNQYMFVTRKSVHKGHVYLQQIVSKTGGNNIRKPFYGSVGGNSDYSIDLAEGEIYNAKGENNPKSRDFSVPYEESRNSFYLRDEELQRLRKLNLGAASTSASSSSSGYETSESGKTNADPSAIPKNCFHKVTFTRDHQIYDSQSELQYQNQTEMKIKMAKLRHNYDVYFLKGTTFARNFHKVFETHLFDVMNFDKNTDIIPKLEKNKKKTYHTITGSSTIHLEKIDYLEDVDCGVVERYDIIPCLNSSWFDLAQEWQTRNRKDWPYSSNMFEIGNLPCHLVPEYMNLEVQDDINNQFEKVAKELQKCNWNLTFPLAERQLETHLSHPQMTVYIIALAMHQAFLLIDGLARGLSLTHIKHTLFWLVERCPDWSELQMGQWVLELMYDLYLNLMNCDMPDYFIQGRNILENVIKGDILHSQKQLKRIIDNPVMFVFHILERIDHKWLEESEKLDFKELLRLLTSEEFMRSSSQREESMNYTHINNTISRSNYEQMLDYQEQNRNCNIRPLINSSRDTASITNIETKCQSLTRERLSPLLNFFSEHFLKLADRYHELGEQEEKDVYLNQAMLLALLLSEDKQWEQEARGIVDRVACKRLKIVPSNPDKQIPAKVPPKPPKRNISLKMSIGTEASNSNSK